MNTTATNAIQNIAAAYLESAKSGQNFMHTGNREELDRHNKLFTSASESFQELIATDSSLYNCELRDIHYAITQGNFAEAYVLARRAL